MVLLKQVLQRGMDRGEFRFFDAEITVHLIFAPLIMHVIWRYSLAPYGVCNVPAAQYLDEYLLLTLRGLRT